MFRSYSKAVTCARTCKRDSHLRPERPGATVPRALAATGFRMKLQVNGKSYEVSVPAGTSLLDVLREKIGITSLKDGCQPQGQCGCCLALIDGSPKTTCAIAADKVVGKQITTLDGIEPLERERLAKAFVAAAGVQCGFCTPGIVLRAHAILQTPGVPSREQLQTQLDGHLCRCTGYTRVLDAIQLAAASKWQGAEIPTLDATGRVGMSPGKIDAERMALGERPYVADMTAEGMLHGALRLSDHARARVLSIDTTAALAMPGVRYVATAQDVPGQLWYGMIYSDWPGFIALGETTQYVGSVLAAVAADDPWVATAAAAAIVVQYEVLTPLTEPEKALLPDAPQVNPAHQNLLSKSHIVRGQAEKALAASDFVVEGHFQTQRIEHLFLETEAAFCVPLAGGRFKLYTQGQGIFDDRRQCAAFVGIAEDDLDVELAPCGGAFGGKEDMSVQAHTVLLAKLTGRPVRVKLTREQSVRVHPKRHPMKLHYKVGCNQDGKLTAVWARILGDSGAHASVGGKVLERAAGHACGPYVVPAVDVEGIAVYTNNPPCGAMRGFGANQAQFAMEGCLDQLAAKVGMDPWDFRYLNAVEVGSVFSTGQILEKSVGVKKTLLAVKDQYRAWQKEGRAVGIACGIKNSGIGNGVAEWGKARLVVEPDETVTIYNGYTEMGQGLSTILAQCACEVTGLPFATFRVKTDTQYQLACGQTTGSRATLLGGNAVISAAEKLATELKTGKTLAQLAGQVYAGDVLTNDTTELGKPLPEGKKVKTHTAFGYATQVFALDQNGKITDVLAAHDVGRAINADLCRGQIEGAVHMGLGYAISEELLCKDGMPTTSKLKDIGVLRPRDTPRIQVLIIEDHEPEGPFGAKGVGEIGLVPTAAAVAGALYQFDGQHRYRLPMKDSPAGRAVSVGKHKARGTDWDA